MSPLEILTVSFCASFVVSTVIVVYSACRVSGDISEREREDDYRWR